jgi:tetratricopeptide (TPR) repeat protein
VIRRVPRFGAFVVSLLLAQPAFAQGASAPAPTSQDPVEEARIRYERGLELFNDAEYVLALAEFERAYQISGNYRVLYNIGQVRIQIGRYSRALDALTEYLKKGEGELDEERRAAVEKDLRMLAERTAKLTVRTNEPGAEILVDGIVVGVSPLKEPLVVDAGEHNVGARKVGFQDKFSAVTLAGRHEATLDLPLVKMKTERPVVVTAESDRTLMWVSWAATGTLALGAGVAGYFGVTKANELESRRTDYPVSQEELQDLETSAQTLFLIADIAGASAIVMGGVSLYLTFSSNDKSVQPATTGAVKSLRVGLAPRGVRVSGSF